MNAPRYGWTINHTVTIDRAGHLTIQQIDAKGLPTQAVDLGTTSEHLPMILVWLDSADRDTFAPAIDAWCAQLLAEYV